VDEGPCTLTQTILDYAYRKKSAHVSHDVLPLFLLQYALTPPPLIWWLPTALWSKAKISAWCLRLIASPPSYLRHRLSQPLGSTHSCSQVLYTLYFPTLDHSLCVLKMLTLPDKRGVLASSLLPLSMSGLNSCSLDSSVK
jgi:hypothetical protein